jgi:hypothetical protein
MGKYDPLKAFLARQTESQVPMTFAEIESLLGGPLPRSRQYPAWWSNNAANNTMTKAWLEAGFVTEQVDVGRERLTFRRQRNDVAGHPPEDWLDRLRSAYRGSVQVEPGYDLTLPTGEVWDAERE